jgi:uncharacterized protein (TIGR02147 family)
MTDLLLTNKDFRSLLQQELIRRCRNNPRYSLRSFAKSLEISSSALTEMINGKRTITKKSIEKCGLIIGLSLDEVDAYIQSTKSPERIAIENSQINYRQITIDQYSLISDWYHYAIIELVKIEGFKSEASWIARALGITKTEASIAIERLLRLSLLEKTETGELVDTSEGYSTNINSDLTSVGAKQFQKQILEQSIEALMTVPIEKRNHTSMTMAINPELLPEAKQRITKFRRELCAFLESKGPKVEIYQMSLSLFPITKLSQHTNGENL